VEIYFDAQVTGARDKAIRAAIDAGKHVYTEKPLAADVGSAVDLVRLARAAGVRNGVVSDKLFLPGLRKLKRLVDGGFFGRILSVRGEFGYWVFEGDWQPAQRPSWNYRSADGGGIVLDMFPHWQYVLEGLFGPVRAVQCVATTHIPFRVDENGAAYQATADDAAYAIFELDGGAIAQINCGCTATSWSSSRSTAPTAARSPGCASAGYSTGPARPCRCGTRTSRRTTTSARSGSGYPTTRSSATGSASSGRRSCGTSSTRRRSRGTSPRGRAAYSWPTWDCAPRARGDA